MSIDNVEHLVLNIVGNLKLIHFFIIYLIFFKTMISISNIMELYFMDLRII